MAIVLARMDGSTPKQLVNRCERLQLLKNNSAFASGAALHTASPIRPQVLMGPGVVPCGLPHGRKDPEPMS
jgi:hypothetical protein